MFLGLRKSPRASMKRYDAYSMEEEGRTCLHVVGHRHSASGKWRSAIAQAFLRHNWRWAAPPRHSEPRRSTCITRLKPRASDAFGLVRNSFVMIAARKKTSKISRFPSTDGFTAPGDDPSAHGLCESLKR